MISMSEQISIKVSMKPFSESLSGSFHAMWDISSMQNFSLTHYYPEQYQEYHFHKLLFYLNVAKRYYQNRNQRGRNHKCY